MALSFGPNLGLLVNGALGEEHYDELMAMFRGLDCLIKCTALDKDLTAPPGSPSDGNTYLVAASATGAWATHDNKIARWSSVLSAWEFFTPKEGWETYVADENAMYRFNGTTWFREDAQVITLVCGDETTAITAGTDKIKLRVPFPFEVWAIRASLSTAQATDGGGGIFTVDVNEDGSSLLSTKITIDNTEKTSTTAAAQPVLSDTLLADDAEITVDVDQVGDGTAKGLKVYLIGRSR
jgi:hypothetical protein